MIVNNKLHFCILFFGVFLFSSCGETPFYDSAYSFKDKKWALEDTASFEFDVTDTVQQYDFVLTLRTTTTYPFSNLWVHVSTTAPDESKSKMAQRINLAAPDGSWIGRVSGTIVESKLHYKTTNFPLEGTYRFDVTHAIQKETVPEVLDLSLRVVAAK